MLILPCSNEPHEGDPDEGPGDQSDVSSGSGDNLILEAPMYDDNDASDPSRGGISGKVSPKYQPFVA